MGLRLLVWLGSESSAVVLGLALLLTYSVHSLLWVISAALLARVRAVSSATRHLLWKTALFGPIGSAVLAVAVSSAFVRSPAASGYVHELELARPVAAEPLGAPRARLPALVPAATPRAGGRGILSFVLAAAGLGCVRFLGSAILIRRRLQDRTKAGDARLLDRMAHMVQRIGLQSIVLTESSRVESPLVLGTTEICIPRSLHGELTDAELDAVLAHELAHIERRDGLWFPLAGALQCILWFQPLNYWVASRFRESAELTCDDRAVELTRNPLGLARALVQVAARSSSARRLAMLPAMSRSKSALLPRLRRLTRAPSAGDAQPSRRARAGATGAIFALGAVLVSLNVQVAEARPELRARVSSPPDGASATAPPDAAEQSRRVGELVRREQLLAAQLAATQPRPNQLSEGAPESTRVIELSQELRHVRAMERWLETRFVDECAAWDRREAQRAAR